MKTFKDSTGVSWSVTINVAAVKRVRDLIGVDLLKLIDPSVPKDEQLLMRLGSDVVLLVDALYAILLPQLQAADPPLDDIGFGTRLEGEAAGDAVKAFWLELTDFFQKLGRTDMAKAMEGQAKVLTAAMRTFEKKISSIDLDALIAAAMNEATQDAKSAISSSGATDSPASSASIPDPSLSAS
jgi:hypothetical protein